MHDRKTAEQPSRKDQLVLRPDEPLPPVDDPGGAHAKGYVTDPQAAPVAHSDEEDSEQSA